MCYKRYMSMEDLPDVCLVDGVEHELRPPPLEPVLRALGLAPIASAFCTACHRGYVARWELRDDALYLGAVEHWDASVKRVDFSAFANWGMNNWRTDAVMLRCDPLDVLTLLPSDCLTRVKEWMNGDRGVPLLADWVHKAGGPVLTLGAGQYDRIAEGCNGY